MIVKFSNATAFYFVNVGVGAWRWVAIDSIISLPFSQSGHAARINARSAATS